MNLNDWVNNFWNRVTPVPGGCLEWQGALNPTNGYPQCRIPLELQVILELNSSTTQVHRAVYAYVLRKKPRHIDHLCNNKVCVNFDHHESVTQAENNVRAVMVRMGTYDADEWTSRADEVWA